MLVRVGSGVGVFVGVGVNVGLGVAEGSGVTVAVGVALGGPNCPMAGSAAQLVSARKHAAQTIRITIHRTMHRPKRPAPAPTKPGPAQKTE